MKKLYQVFLIIIFPSLVFAYDVDIDDINNNQESINVILNDDEIISVFITDMFNNKHYYSDVFLKEHCSKSLLKKLRDAYEYEGDWYNFRLFDNGAQDVRYSDGDERNNNRIINVTPIGDGWYLYEYYSSGWRGKNAIHATVRDGVVWMNDIRKIYSELDNFD